METTFAFQLREKLASVHSLAREFIAEAQEVQERQYNRKEHLVRYQVGDKVWLHDVRRRKGLSPKLSFNWDGPYTVKRVISDWLYQIVKGEGKAKVVHHNRLKADMGSNPVDHPEEEESTPAQAPQELEVASGDEGEDLIVSDDPEEVDTLPIPETAPVLPAVTRAGRVSKRPGHLRDFTQ